MELLTPYDTDLARLADKSRDMTLRRQLAASICLALFIGTCRVAPSSDPYRCLEGINLGQLIQAEVPQDQQQGWSLAGTATASENRLFDNEQEAVLEFGKPSPFPGRLCDRLKAQLAERCNVEKFWSGPEHCAAFLISPSAAVTSSQGTYSRRPVHGRVTLFTSKTVEGKMAIILTATEWAQ